VRKRVFNVVVLCVCLCACVCVCVCVCLQSFSSILCDNIAK
jgi:hypothetical protein